MLNIPQIFPNLSSLEQNRQSQASRYKLYKTLIWVSVVALITGAILAPEKDKYPHAPWVVLGAIIAIWVLWRLRRKLRVAYTNQASAQIFAPLIKSTLPDASYNHNAFIPASIFNQSGLFPTSASTTFQGEDLIEATLDGFGFKCSQLTVYQRVSGKSSKQTTTKKFGKTKTVSKSTSTTSTHQIFQGFFVVVDMPTAQISGQTLVQYDLFQDFKAGIEAVKGFFGKNSPASTQANQSLSADFEKEFNVKTDEPQVLTPSLCEFLTQLNHRDTQVGLSIAPNRVCMSMATKSDFLATDISEPVSAELLQTYANEWEQTLSNIRTLIKLLKSEQLS